MNYLLQVLAFINLLMFSDNYSRSSTTNTLWYKKTKTGAAGPRKYRTLTTSWAAPVIPDTDTAHKNAATIRVFAALVAGNTEFSAYN